MTALVVLNVSITVSTALESQSYLPNACQRCHFVFRSVGFQLLIFPPIAASHHIPLPHATILFSKCAAWFCVWIFFFLTHAVFLLSLLSLWCKYAGNHSISSIFASKARETLLAALTWWKFRIVCSGSAQDCAIFRISAGTLGLYNNLNVNGFSSAIHLWRLSSYFLVYLLVLITS